MIGIVGANGEIGNLCIKFLKDYGINNIKAGIRNRNLLEENSNFSYDYIDLSNKESCISFAKNCDCVINCATANKEGIKNLVEAVELGKTKLVDLTYYRNIELPKVKNSLICHGVGVSPGLTEFLPKIITKHFDEVESLNLYYVTIDKFTYSSAKSYLEYLDSSNIYPMTEINEWKLQATSYNGEAISLKNLSVKLKQIPYMDNRSISICRNLGIKNAKFNICMPDGETYKLLMNPNFRKFDKSEKIRKLIIASRLDVQIFDSYCAMLVESKGQLRNNEVFHRFLIEEKSSANLTAIISVAVAVKILKNTYDVGIYEMANLEYSSKFLSLILDIDKKANIILENGENTLFKNSIGGEI